jgi:radical SAM protein with 4Fe4S-binding SPASM domain
MDVEQWTKIIAGIQPYAKSLRITGGEPTLHKQFALLLGQVDLLGIPFVLFTNGNWRNADAVIETLLGCANLKGLLVSLHGSHADAYQDFTGVDAFEKVLANIRLATSAGLRVATNTLLLTNTLDHLPVIAEAAFAAGAANVSFGRYYGPALKGLSPTPAVLKRALSQIAEMRQKDRRISLSNCVPACFSPNEDFGGGGCTSGFTHCTIGPAGDVRPCTHSEVVLGYMPHDDIAGLWKSAALTQWRNLIPDDCLDCRALSTCRGGCRAVARKLATPYDPLHVKPLKAEPQFTVIEVGLLDRPKLSCSVEATKFGFVLSGSGHYVTLSHHSLPILQMLDGKTTVKKIKREHGPASLELIGGLLQQRLVELT